MTEESLFVEALSRSPEERAAFLEQACAGRPELRAAVESLLAALEKSGNILDKPPAGLGQTVGSELGVSDHGATGEHALQPDDAPAHHTATNYCPDAEPGVVIAGRYTLVEKIGEGGMGEVWVAKQTEPVRRKVALKLIKAGMDSKAVLQRFEQERQALALMDHPNIARVLDGGLTPERRPFFVMELVNGLPLTRFCDEARLGIRERLELFTLICQAVQHAHQKGVVHRDLKPANILVTLIDGHGVPKIIDFGVAKATSGRLTDETLSTQFGAVVGTLEYMAPEQAGFAGEDIDTRADIYSLGVLLYELLTGLRPIDARRLKQAAFTEMVRIIKEEEPPLPSTRLSTDEAAPSLAALRQTEPRKLTALLRGELDWVVLKCLEKQRDRRYETANGLARDLQRYLADEPVEARPPSAGYRLGKFLKRNKGQVLAASLVLLALVGGIVGTTLGLFEARRQEKLARDETAEKEEARRDEAERVKERDQALGTAKEALTREAERVKERDKANDELKHRLGISNMLLANAAFDNRDVVLAAERLEMVPVEQRGWDWRFLKQQTRGGLFTLYGQRGPVTCVSFSPDGMRILSAGGNQNELGEAKVWDARTGAFLLDLKGLPQVQGMNTPVTNAAFSPDGTRIITAGEGKIARVCDAKTGKVLLELKGHTTSVASFAFSPDGTRIVTGGDSQPRVLGAGRITGVQGPGEVKVWDARTGTALFELKGHTGGVSSVSFSSDGTRVVTTGDDFGMPDEVKVWDAGVGGPPLLELQGNMGTYRTASISPDGKRIVTGREDGTATVMDAQTGAVLLELKGYTRAAQDAIQFTRGVLSAAFSPDGTRIVTAGGFRTQGEVTLWDARTGAVLLDLRGHTSLVMSAAFSPDGMRIVTGSMDGTIKTWDARTGMPRLALTGRHGDVTCVSISPDGTRIVTGGGETRKAGEATVWDARTGAPLFELKGIKGIIKCVSFSPDGTRIVTGGGEFEKPGEATVWDAQTGTALFELKGFKQSVTGVSFSPDGTRFVTGEGEQANSRGTVKVWDAQTAKHLYDLTEEGPEFVFTAGLRGESVAFSPDGTRIVIGGFRDQNSAGADVKVVDARTGKTLVLLRANRGAVHCVAFSRDGTRIATGGSDGTVFVWDAQTGNPRPFELKGHSGDVNSVDFSPDGTRVVSGSADKTVKVWDVRTGTMLVELKGHTGAVMSVSFSRDGSRIVSGGRGFAGKSGETIIWDPRSETAPLELKGHTDSIASVSFSPDSTRIATASQDGRVLLWDTRTGTVLHNLVGFKGNVQDVAFSPDGTRLVTTGDSTAAKVWDARMGTAVFELKRHPIWLASVAFSPDGTRIVTAGHRTDRPNEQKGEATVWDAQTGTALFELTGHAASVHRVSFSPDGTRIVTRSYDGRALVWDARTGKKLPNEPIPDPLEPGPVSPDGRLFARRAESRVELISLKPDAEEIEYRLRHTRPDFRRYREGYLAARAAKDDFAARFYLNLVPPADRTALVVKADIDALVSLTKLAEEHVRAGKPELAIPLFVEIVNGKKAGLGPENADTLQSMNRLGVVYWQMRQFEKAIPVFEELLRIHEAKLGRDHVETQRTVANLGVNYKDAGKLKEAIPLLEEAHRAAKKYPDLRFASGQLQDAYVKAGEHAKVVALLQEQLAEVRKALPKDSPQLAGVLAQVGLSLLEQKQWTEAETVIRECLAIREKAQPDLWMTFNSRAQLGAALLGQKKYGDAEPLLVAGYEGMKQREKTIPPQGRPRLTEAALRLVQLYEALEKKDEAAKWRKELEARKAEPKGENKP
jgi:WD40 repeat protein/tetratricopeptide (TPR) repeat protein